jgi:hypothetical protein
VAFENIGKISIIRITNPPMEGSPDAFRTT